MRLWLAVVFGVQMSMLTQANAAPWVNFTDPKGQFSVMFPIAPTAKTAATWGPGKHYPVTAYAVMEGTARLLLMVLDTDLEGVNADAKSILDNQESNLRQGITTETVKIITVDGVTGRYLVLNRFGSHQISEIFFSRGHLYQVLASTSPAASSEDVQDAQRFSESFHFSH